MILEELVGTGSVDVTKLGDTLWEYSQEVTQDKKLSLEGVWDWVLAELPGRVALWAAQEVAKRLPALVFPGAAALLGIWNVLQFVIKYYMQLAGLLETAGQLLQSVRDGKDHVKTAVKKGLKSILALVLRLLASCGCGML